MEEINKKKLSDRILDWIEKSGNVLPDPAILFFAGLIIVWVLSAIFSGIEFTEIDPRTGDNLKVINLLSGREVANFFATMVQTFIYFAPLGVVLVAVLGVGVAEQSGYVNTGLKILLKITPKKFITPMVLIVGIASHSAADAGYVLIVPLAGIIYYSAGRHPLAGIAVANAGIAGGFSANYLISALDVILQGFTQSAAQIIDPSILVNPLCNYYFMAISSILIVGLGWYLTDWVIEPRLTAHTPVDDKIDDAPEMGALEKKEKRAFIYATIAIAAAFSLLFIVSLPEDSVLRDSEGQLTSFKAPLMQALIPFIFVAFVLPGIIYGFMAGTFTKAKDVIDSMTKAMNGMSYYVVMVFFAALFIDAFGSSNLGALLALKGAAFLQALSMPKVVTVIGIIFLTAVINIFVGSASAKWALLAPIFVPMLMALGISPELTQAAYRIGDSSSNIITPLSPYLPLIVVFAQRYVKKTGIGTIISMMFPYFIAFIIGWTILLLVFWGLDIPLGVQAGYNYIVK
ncbi:MAG: AbgT family transporter [Melioribacteraceae bacterium]|nr:AbgT family transporter [Melioribacteraceae bacterium]